MKGKIVITGSRCKACMLCVEACNKNAICQGTVLNEAGYVPVVFNKDNDCNGCALCAIRCPEVAIEVYRGE